MKILWAPWRMEYILGPKPDSCVLCVPSTPEEDIARRILYRGKHAFVIMNKYPYNNGHLMVTPYRHVMDLIDLDNDEQQEIMQLLHTSCSLLRQHCHPEGMNVGLNIGQAAGAGIREHLHFHIVPRWNGDSSFMAVLDEVRVVPEHLDVAYTALKGLFDTLKLA